MSWQEDRKLLARVRRSRSQALNNPARAEWMNSVDVIADYLDGKQYPENYDPEKDDQYLVLNTLPDFVDRITAMVGGGRLDVTMVKRDESVDELVKMARALFEYLKEVCTLKGQSHEGIHDVVAFGVATWRGFVDPTRIMPPGPFIGLEVVTPGQVWINPRANNPYHPLFGSEYIGYESWRPRNELMDEFPKKARYIRDVPAMDLSQLSTLSIDHPLYHATRSIREDGAIDVEGSHGWSRAGPADTGRIADHDKEYDPLAITEYVYESIEQREVLDMIVPVRVWKTFTVIGAIDEDDKSVIAKPDEEIPYGLPPFVMCMAQKRAGSPWSLGLPWRILDPQDMVNVFTSDEVVQLQADSQWRETKFTRPGVFDENDKDQVLEGNPPHLIELDPKNEFPDAPFNALLGQVDVTDIDWSKKTALRNGMLDLMRTLIGVHSPVIGDISMEKRVSGIALSTAQQAVLVAQETLRLHVDMAMTNIGRMLWALVRHYWIWPHHLPAMEGHQDYWLNQRVVATPETAAAAEQALNTKNYQDEEGRVMVPTSFHAVTGDNEEVVLPIQEKEQIIAAVQSPGFTSTEFGFNYMPLLDLDVKMVVDADYAQKNEKRRNDMSWAAQMPKGVWAMETIWTEAMRDNPGWSADVERRKLFGDQIAAVLTQIAGLGDQAQAVAMQALQQALQALLAPGQQGGSQTQMGQAVEGAGPPVAETVSR